MVGWVSSCYRPFGIVDQVWKGEFKLSHKTRMLSSFRTRELSATLWMRIWSIYLFARFAFTAIVPFIIICISYVIGQKMVLVEFSGQASSLSIDQLPYKKIVTVERVTSSAVAEKPKTIQTLADDLAIVLHSCQGRYLKSCTHFEIQWASWSVPLSLVFVNFPMVAPTHHLCREVRTIQTIKCLPNSIPQRDKNNNP